MFFLDKTSFSEAKLSGFYGKISKKITIKVRGYCLIKEMPVVYM